MIAQGAADFANDQISGRNNYAANRAAGDERRAAQVAAKAKHEQDAQPAAGSGAVGAPTAGLSRGFNGWGSSSILNPNYVTDALSQGGWSNGRFHLSGAANTQNGSNIALEELRGNVTDIAGQWQAGIAGLTLTSLPGPALPTFGTIGIDPGDVLRLPEREPTGIVDNWRQVENAKAFARNNLSGDQLDKELAFLDQRGADWQASYYARMSAGPALDLSSARGINIALAHLDPVANILDALGAPQAAARERGMVEAPGEVLIDSVEGAVNLARVVASANGSPFSRENITTSGTWTTNYGMRRAQEQAALPMAMARNAINGLANLPGYLKNRWADATSNDPVRIESGTRNIDKVVIQTGMTVGGAFTGAPELGLMGDVGDLSTISRFGTLRDLDAFTLGGAPETEVLSPFTQKYLSTSGGRLGGIATREQLYGISQDYVKSGKYVEFNGGGLGSEELIRGVGPGSKGGTYVDFTARAADGSAVRVQTIDTLADGITATPREAAAAARIRAAFPNDQLILIPKGRR